MSQKLPKCVMFTYRPLRTKLNEHNESPLKRIHKMYEDKFSDLRCLVDGMEEEPAGQRVFYMIDAMAFIQKHKRFG